MKTLFRIPRLALIFSLLFLSSSALLAICLGAANIPILVILDFIIQIFSDDLEGSKLSEIEKTIILEWRLPRFALGALVGASLSVAGAGFRVSLEIL